MKLQGFYKQLLLLILLSNYMDLPKVLLFPRSKDLQSEAMLIRGFLIHTLLPRDYIV